MKTFSVLCVCGYADCRCCCAVLPLLPCCCTVSTWSLKRISKLFEFECLSRSNCAAPLALKMTLAWELFCTFFSTQVPTRRQSRSSCKELRGKKKLNILDFFVNHICLSIKMTFSIASPLQWKKFHFLQLLRQFKSINHALVNQPSDKIVRYDNKIIFSYGHYRCHTAEILIDTLSFFQSSP